MSISTKVLSAACALLLAACATAGTGTAPTTTAPTSTAVSPITVASPTVTAAATTSRTPSATGATAVCATSSLRVTLGRGDGAAGHYYVPIVFTNVGPTCTITGYPGVSYYAGADQHQVGDAAAWEPGAVRAVVLGTGESAYAWLNQVNVDNYDSTVCEPVAATGLRVYSPNNTGSVLLPEPNARGCARPMAGQGQLTVRAVAEGSGPS